MTFDCADFYDAELRRLDPHFRAAMAVGDGDRVLDIGCGAGQSSRHAARLAGRGSVLGIDISDELLAAARRRAADDGLRNVTFVSGDAQHYPLPAGYFDICISRFGVMFFDDPVAALTNVARALRPGARVVFMVWQDQARNAWSTTIQAALSAQAMPSRRMPAAFSMGDRAETTRILTEAGFASVQFTDVQAPVFYGHHADTAFEAIVRLFLASDTPADIDTLPPAHRGRGPCHNRRRLVRRAGMDHRSKQAGRLTHSDRFQHASPACSACRLGLSSARHAICASGGLK